MKNRFANKAAGIYLLMLMGLMGLVRMMLGYTEVSAIRAVMLATGTAAFIYLAFQHKKQNKQQTYTI
ncbi:hypothetical protein [Terribacillus sp. DMT04]|uniref:hypothetical protein n=1 Tax=Terribacillus sp. DMT04 TaxID=2850441 RepID=UPI001C2CADC8|nr:hypothetical protein [Terribacillus sp. DMT04]QXE00196.1 hypothetical protein KS242_09070 [Terribacillus sp. DMT04]